MRYFMALGLLFVLGCGDDKAKDNGPHDTDETCYENPTNHVELINACTAGDVEKIDKNPVLPLLNPDGSLPDLP